MKIYITRHLLAALPATLLCTSCANTSHLVVFQHSNLGVNAGVSPATGNLHVRVGLRREFAAVVPKIEQVQPVALEEEGKQPKQYQAASSYVSARMRVTGAFTTPQITEVLATGQAAVNVAQGDSAPKFITDLTKQ